MGLIRVLALLAFCLFGAQACSPYVPLYVRPGQIEVRSCPSRDCYSIATLYKGTEIEPLDSQDGWYKLRTDKFFVGWVDGMQLGTDRDEWLNVPEQR